MIGSNAVVKIYNIELTSGIDQYPADPDFSNVEAYIESQGSQITQVLGQQQNIETFEMHIDPLDIKIGAKVLDDKDREYRITGIERHEGNDDVEDTYKVTMNSQHIAP